MRRATTRRPLSGRWRLAASALAVLAAACGAFELGDVVPYEESGAPPDGRAAEDAPSSETETGPCVPNGDPCNCLAPPSTISPGPHGTGQAISVSGSNVYFMVTDFGGGAGSPVVFRAPIDGAGDGGATQASLQSPIAPSMALGASWLFFRRTSAPVALARISIDATGQTPASYVGPLSSAPGNLATDSTHVFWAGDFGAVCEAPFDGAGPVVDGGIAGCSGSPLVAPHDGGPSNTQLAASDTAVFLMYNSRIYAAPQSTGIPSQIVAQTGSTLGNLLDDRGQLYWTNVVADAGTIWSALDDGGDAKLIVRSPLEGSALAPTIAVDANGIYWSQRNYSKVWGASRDGSNVHLLACENAGAPALTTDATYVYWVTSDGAVRRVPKM